MRGSAALTAAGALAQPLEALAQPSEAQAQQSESPSGDSPRDSDGTAPSNAPDSTSASTGTQAANKATARTAATEGIKLFREQRFAEALDKMQRAQALYDAPVHVLYIARCQAELGQLILAAESYRNLSKTQLPADAPDAFERAVQDGTRELRELEPRIPSLLVRVVPTDAPNLSFRVDGEDVPSAAIGIKRLINPGHHTLSVSADGYAPHSERVDVPEGELVEVSINLTPAEAEASDRSATEAEVDVDTPPTAERQRSLDSVSFLIGLRLGIAAPAGRLPGQAAHPQLQEAVRFPDVATTGGELELRMGAHFLNRWGVFAFLNAQPLGDAEDTFQGDSGLASGLVTAAPGKPNAATLGLAVMGGTERGKFGGFAELGVGFHRVAYATELSVAAGGSCAADVQTGGLAARLSLGLNVPVRRRLLHLTPYFTWQLGSAGSVEYSVASDCAVEGPGKLDIDDDPGHSVLSLGVGGDFFFGGN